MKISDFVIGLGFDASNFNKGMKNATQSLGGFRSDVLQLGAALSSVFGFKALTFDFAKTNDELRQMAQLYGVTTNELYGLDAAAQSFGANSGQILGVLGKIASTTADFKNLGKIGIFEDLALLGVDFDKIANAKNSVEAMYALSDQLAKLSQDKRLQAANILGLSAQEVDMMVKGGKSVREQAEYFQKARPHTEEMAKAARELTEQWTKLEALLGGRADRISTPLVSAIASVTASTNKWIEANQKLIDQKIDVVMKAIGDNLDLIIPIAAGFAGTKIVKTFADLGRLIPGVGGAIRTVAAGFAGTKIVKTFAVLGRLIPGVGGAIGTVAAGLSRLVPLVAVLTTAMELWDWDEKDFKEHFGIELPHSMFVPLNELFSDSKKELENNVKSGKYSEDVKELQRNAENWNKNSYTLPTLNDQDIGSVYSIGQKKQDVYTTATINLTMDGEVVGTKSVEMLNGQIRSAQGDVKQTEDY